MDGVTLGCSAKSDFVGTATLSVCEALRLKNANTTAKRTAGITGKNFKKFIH